jgi:hypothetical protein
MFKDQVAATTFEQFASISTITGLKSLQETDNDLILQLTEVRRDFAQESKLKTTFGLVHNSKSTVKLPKVADEHVIIGKKQTISLRSVNEKRFLCLSQGSIEVTKYHGPFYEDDFFGRISLSADETMITYVAEEKAPEDDSKFTHFYDAGEGYTGKRKACLVVANLITKDIQVLQFSSLFGAAQPFFVGDRVYFVGIPDESTRLGIKFCTNRKSSLYSCRLDGFDLKRCSDANRSVRYPQLSPDGKTILYLSNRIAKSHDSCGILVSFDIVTQEEYVVVNEVKKSEPQDFPGLFCFSLKDNR